MRIAFYAPLKAPSHPVPSGDRRMAQLLMEALTLAGHEVELASELRAYLPDAEPETIADLQARAEAERARLAAQWRRNGPPDLWLSYHSYYKAPDFVGPELSREFGVEYATAEASYSARRGVGLYGRTQECVVEAVRSAAANICFTRRDHAGLLAIAPNARFAMLPPFIDTAPFAESSPTPEPGRLIAVAMMRRGDKFESFKFLAQALRHIADAPWTLTIIGDGPLRPETQALFAGFSERVMLTGELAPEAVAEQLGSAELYVWPGCGEAYGLAYLEAQAAGVPIIAQHTAGVPEVVRDGETGVLTPETDVSAFADTIRRLLGAPAERRKMAQAARRFVLEERSLPQAAQRLKAIFAS